MTVKLFQPTAKNILLLNIACRSVKMLNRLKRDQRCAFLCNWLILKVQQK
jgi:hypothetical protein